MELLNQTSKITKFWGSPGNYDATVIAAQINSYAMLICWKLAAIYEDS